MACKIGQIIRRGSSAWLVRTYVGRNPETQKCRYVGKLIHDGLRSAQADLNRMLAERDLGRNIYSSRQTVSCPVKSRLQKNSKNLSANLNCEDRHEMQYCHAENE